MRALIAWLSGALFAIGLSLGHMTDPKKVIAFLDLFGDWDPSLALVMGGALGAYALVLKLVMRRPAPLFDERFHLPTRRDVDKRLIAGGALFGAGWGIAGFCPGPAITSVGSGEPTALLFVIAMTVGMLLERLVDRTREPAGAPASADPT